MILRANHQELLSGNEKEGINLVIVKNNWFHTSFTRNSYFYKLNDANGFQGPKLDTPIKWE